MASSRLKQQALPVGWKRFLFRAPIYLYRAKLGFLLGKRFLLIEHTGRKSGVEHSTVVEVVAIRSESVYVASGWGEKADWYQNVLQHPTVDIQLGSKKRSATGERVSDDEAKSVLAEYQSNHRRTFEKLASFMLEEPGASPAAAIENLVQVVPILEFRPN